MFHRAGWLRRCGAPHGRGGLSHGPFGRADRLPPGPADCFPLRV